LCTKGNLLAHIHLPSHCTTYRTTIRRIIQKTTILLQWWLIIVHCKILCS
jgi:hypothetical protein